MLHVALTGNIAAGKSAVAELFRGWGATLVDADAIVHELQAPGTDVFEAIVHRFGGGVVAPDGSLHRAALRTMVLADAAALADLNAIVHPAVHQQRARRVDDARRRGDAIVVSVIPLLFEAANPGAFDAVILVDAPEARRLTRLIETRGLTVTEAKRLMAAQQPAGPKRARSDYVIDNAGDRATLEQRAADVWAALHARAARRRA